MTKPEDWISVYITDDGTIVASNGKARDHEHDEWRLATEKEMSIFEEV